MSEVRDVFEKICTTAETIADQYHADDRGAWLQVVRIVVNASVVRMCEATLREGVCSSGVRELVQLCVLYDQPLVDEVEAGLDDAERETADDAKRTAERILGVAQDPQPEKH